MTSITSTRRRVLVLATLALTLLLPAAPAYADETQAPRAAPAATAAIDEPPTPGPRPCAPLTVLTRSGTTGDPAALVLTAQSLAADQPGWDFVQWEIAPDVVVERLLVVRRDGTALETVARSGTADAVLELVLCGTRDPAPVPPPVDTDGGQDADPDGAEEPAPGRGHEATQDPDAPATDEITPGAPADADDGAPSGIRPASAHQREERDRDEVPGVAHEPQLPRTATSVLALAIIGVSGIGLGSTLLRRRAPGT